MLHLEESHAVAGAASLAANCLQLECSLVVHCYTVTKLDKKAVIIFRRVAVETWNAVSRLWSLYVS